jgi:hypothetical protein
VRIKPPLRFLADVGFQLLALCRVILPFTDQAHEDSEVGRVPVRTFGKPRPQISGSSIGANPSLNDAPQARSYVRLIHDRKSCRVLGVHCGTLAQQTGLSPDAEGFQNASSARERSRCSVAPVAPL